jgi:hypothetical protein
MSLDCTVSHARPDVRARRCRLRGTRGYGGRLLDLLSLCLPSTQWLMAALQRADLTWQSTRQPRPPHPHLAALASGADGRQTRHNLLAASRTPRDTVSVGLARRPARCTAAARRPARARRRPLHSTPARHETSATSH